MDKKPKPFVKIKVNLENVKIELFGDNAYSCLREVNKMLEKIRRVAYDNLDELGIDYHLEHPLSDELILNKDVTKILNNLSEIYPRHKISRVAIENKKVVELEKGSVQNQLDLNDVNQSVAKLLYNIPLDKVKEAIIHIKGTIAEDEAKKVTDKVGHQLGNVEVHFVFTKTPNLSHTIIEGIFFGEFYFEEHEQ